MRDDESRVLSPALTRKAARNANVHAHVDAHAEANGCETSASVLTNADADITTHLFSVVLTHSESDGNADTDANLDTDFGAIFIANVHSDTVSNADSNEDPNLVADGVSHSISDTDATKNADKHSHHASNVFIGQLHSSLCGNTSSKRSQSNCANRMLLYRYVELWAGFWVRHSVRDHAPIQWVVGDGNLFQRRHSLDMAGRKR